MNTHRIIAVGGRRPLVAARAPRLALTLVCASPGWAAPFLVLCLLAQQVAAVPAEPQSFPRPPLSVPPGDDPLRPHPRAADTSRVLTLELGPFAVGFKAYDLVDETRTYWASIDALGRPIAGARGRPLQTSVWYPARNQTGRSMRYRDYVALGLREQGPARAAAKDRARYFDGFRASSGVDSSTFATILTTPVAALENAVPAEGRFPVVVYLAGGGQRSWDNSVLAEYLASHGYVVVAAPDDMMPEYLSSAEPSPASAETAARDMEFLIGFAVVRPNVDRSRIGLMGFSWGGLSGPLVAMRRNDIGAVVALDGSIKYYPEIWRAALHNDTKRMQAAFLMASQSAERVEQQSKIRKQPLDSASQRRITMPFEFFDALASDGYWLEMLQFHHGNFSSSAQNFSADPGREEPTRAADFEGYRVMSRYVLAFLNGYLRDRTDERQWLRQSPSENGVRDGVVRVRQREAGTGGPVALERFIRDAAPKGFDRLEGTYAEAKARDSSYMVSDRDLMRWASLLFQEEKSEEGLAVLRFGVVIHPRSVPVREWLCGGLVRMNRVDAARECFAKLLELDPENQPAKEFLSKK